MIKVDELFQTQIKQTFPQSKQLSLVGKACAARYATGFSPIIPVTFHHYHYYLVLLYLTTVPRTMKLFEFAILFFY